MFAADGFDSSLYAEGFFEEFPALEVATRRGELVALREV